VISAGAASVAVSVDIAALGKLGAPLGRGGEATVHELPGFSVPTWKGPLVYKAYRRPHEDPARLRKIVRLREQLTSARRAVLDRIAAWPLRVVEDAGDVVGLVMPRISDDYFADVLSPTGNRLRFPRDVESLFIAPRLASRLKHQIPTDEQRISLCRDFAAALAFLHDELDVAFGDINHANELYRLEPKTGVLLIDCDGVRPRGVVTLHKQLNTPDWVPPEGGVLNPETDRYKLGLFVLRCLAPGAFGAAQIDPVAAAGVLDQAGQDLLRDALGAVPAARPTAAGWRSYLSAVLGEYDDPPELTGAHTTRRYVLRGQPVEIAWTARRAVEIEVRADGRSVTADGRAGSGAIAVDLLSTGFIQVRARNDIGEDTTLLGPVAVIEPPRQTSMPVLLPPVVFPELDDVMPVLLLPELPAPAPLPPPAIVVSQPQAAAPLRMRVPMAPPFSTSEIIGAGPVFSFDRTTPAEEAP
jgi:hypothetical protein